MYCCVKFKTNITTVLYNKINGLTEITDESRTQEITQISEDYESKQPKLSLYTIVRSCTNQLSLPAVRRNIFIFFGLQNRNC
jgi:hypothetical protein